jgi:hypothetical protein
VQTNYQGTLAAAGDASGSMVFAVDGQVVATQPVTAGVAAYSTSALTATGHDLTVSYTGDNNYTTNGTTAALPQTVSPATPALSGLTVNPTTISYGTTSVTVSGTLSTNVVGGLVYPPAGETVSVTIGASNQVATIGASGAFSITFLTGTLPAANYAVAFAYNAGGADTNFTAASDATTAALTVSPATPAFSGLTSSQGISYGTASVTLGGTLNAGGVYPPAGDAVAVTINGITEQPAISDATGDFTVSFPTAGLGVSGSPYTITYAYNSAGADGNFTTVSDTSTALTVAQATPVFSNLSSPSITYGTANVTLNGTLGINGVYPPPHARIHVTIYGVTRHGIVTDATGDFTLESFPTATIPAAGPAYPITYAYDGDANFTAASDSTAGLTVGEASSGWTYSGGNGGVYSYIYNGAAQGPSPSEGGSTASPTTLYAGTNLQGVAYSNAGAPTNAGVYYVSNTVASDGDYVAATGSQLFTIAPATNAIALVSGEATSSYGDAVTFTATVQTNYQGTLAAAGDASGSMVFAVDGQVVESISV